MMMMGRGVGEFSGDISSVDTKQFNVRGVFDEKISFKYMKYNNKFNDENMNSQQLCHPSPFKNIIVCLLRHGLSLTSICHTIFRNVIIQKGLYPTVNSREKYKLILI